MRATVDMLERRRQYYSKHRDKIREQARRRYPKHRDKILADNKVWMQKNRDRRRVYEETYREKNRGKINAVKRERYRTEPAYRRARLDERLRYVARYRDKLNSKRREWDASHPEWVRDQRLRHFRGITLKQFNEMLAHQDGRCAICRRTLAETGQRRPFSVDHDHATGRVRGLLCARCNTYVGYLEKNAELRDAVSNYIAPAG